MSASMSASVSRGAVLVTGASTGIGRACALALDAAGWHVFAGVRRERDAQALREEASARIRPIGIDLDDAAAIAAAVATMERATHGAGLWGVVHAARVGPGRPAPRALALAVEPLLRRGHARVLHLGLARSWHEGLAREQQARLRGLALAVGFVALGSVETERSRRAPAGACSPHEVAAAVRQALEARRLPARLSVGAAWPWRAALKALLDAPALRPQPRFVDEA